MNRLQYSLMGLILTSGLYATDNLNNSFMDKAHPKEFSKEERTKTQTHYHQAKIFMDKRDLKSAEMEFDKILEIIPHNLYSDDYIFALLAKAKLYAHFERLTEAEKSVLLACGIPAELAKEIAKTQDLQNQDRAKKLIKKVEALLDKDNFYGYHAARSYLLKVANMQDIGYEKQREKARDTMGQYALHLYPQLLRLRAMRIDRMNRVKALQKRLKNTTNPQEIAQLEHQLAYGYSFLEDFDKALALSNRHLSKNPKDLDALYNKMNIAMSQGAYQKMQAYEQKIVAIKPDAFK